MHCPRCDHPLPEGATACDRCGAFEVDLASGLGCALGLLLGAVGWAVGYGTAVVGIDFLLGGRPARGVLVAPAVVAVVLAGATGALAGLALGWRLPRRLVKKRWVRPGRGPLPRG